MSIANFVEPIKNIEDIQRITNYLGKKPIYKMIWLIGIYSGLRISDILGLNIFDVEDKKMIILKEQKTGKIKQFPIKEELQKEIKKYLKIRKQQWSVNKQEPLFVGKKHKRLDRSQVYRVINKVCNELGIQGNFGTHTMRKTFGYHHYKKFKDIAILQQIFNHSSPSITLRYIGITQENINDSYNNFNYGIEIKEEKQENFVKKYQKYKKVSNEKNITEFLQNYLQSGAMKHRAFAELALMGVK